MEIFLIILSAVGNNDIDLTPRYIASYPQDAKNIIFSPIHWDRGDWIKALGIMGTGVILYLNDGKMQDWAQRNRNDVTNNISRYATYFGEKKMVAPSLLLFYLYGKFSHNKKTKYTALIGLEGFILSGIFTNIIKYSAHRSRPYTNDPPDKWGGPSFSLSDNYLSFPSGHSTTAFAIATVLANEYRFKFSSLLFYSLSTLTAISRVNDNKHWVSDVFFGAVIGYTTSRALLFIHRQKNIKVGFSPYLNGEYIGVRVSIKG